MDPGRGRHTCLSVIDAAKLPALVEDEVPALLRGQHRRADDAALDDRQEVVEGGQGRVSQLGAPSRGERPLGISN